MGFKLHPQLEKDTIFVANLDVCQLRLMNDSRFLWLVLVPRIENAIELHDLPLFEQGEIFNEITTISKLIKNFGHFDKINIGALGNIVSQLHIHIIGRKINDAAWPGPVWGNGTPVPYHCSNETLNKLKSHM